MWRAGSADGSIEGEGFRRRGRGPARSVVPAWRVCRGIRGVRATPVAVASLGRLSSDFGTRLAATLRAMLDAAVCGAAGERCVTEVRRAAAHAQARRARPPSPQDGARGL